ncbi:hypothetical protein Tco_1387662 [Tanacetum coccineum]
MLPVVCKNCRLTPQLHESAGGLPSLKLPLHSCSLPGSMNATQVSFWGGRLHFREVEEQICKFGKPQGAYLQISLVTPTAWGQVDRHWIYTRVADICDYMKDVHGWKVGESVHHYRKWLPHATDGMCPKVIKLLFSKCVRLFAAMEVSLKGISSGLRSLDTSQLCADVGAALAPATTATSGHRKDEILTTQCSLLIYEKLLNKKKQLP